MLNPTQRSIGPAETMGRRRGAPRRDIGLWVTNRINDYGSILPVGSMANEFSDWGDGTKTDAHFSQFDDGAQGGSGLHGSARGLTTLRAVLLLATAAITLTASAGFAGGKEQTTEATGRIAFVRGSQVWVMKAEGSGQRRLTWGRGSKSSPAWSPDGRRIAYAYDTEVIRNVGTRQEYTAYPSHIFVINADGSRAQRLTRTEEYAYEQKRSPAWSPDGRTIVFERYDDGDYWISIVGGDGARQRSLTRGWPPEDADPAWSPDGRKIAFTNVHNGAVYVMRPDGSGRRALATMGGAASRSWDVAWSPDGREIAFFSDGDLWLMNADGTRPRRLVESFGQGSGSLTWSPNGRMVAFSVLERGKPRRSPDADSEIYVVNADGSELRNLTHNDRVLDEYPVWSPGGRAIAFTSDRDGNSEIYVMDADGSDQRNVSQSPAEDVGPAWSPKE